MLVIYFHIYKLGIICDNDSYIITKIFFLKALYHIIAHGIILYKIVIFLLSARHVFAPINQP